MAPKEGVNGTNGEAACCKGGCGYPSPLDAMKYGPREKILYINCVALPAEGTQPRPDCLATIDVDPESETYCKVIHRLNMLHVGDELHHYGWNACSSCYGVDGVTRSKLCLFSLLSNRVYIVDVSQDERAPRLHKVVEPEEVWNKAGGGYPHSMHCLPSREVMCALCGDKDDNAKGSFVLLDSETFEVKGNWEGDGNSVPFGYAFWYQPHFNVMVSAEWGAPKAFKHGVRVIDVKNGLYGCHLNVWNWKERTLNKRINLGSEGLLPFEVRFLHDPKQPIGYAGTALSANVFMIYKNDDTGEWDAEKVIDVPDVPIDNWILPGVPGMMTDNLISLDDRFLYASLYFHGEVRQYDITDRRNPKLVGKVHLGGLFHKGSTAYPNDDSVLPQDRPTERVVIKGVTFQGGPHKMQLSLDGKRMYVTNSLFSIYDRQFYPEMMEKGGQLVRIHVDNEKGGLTLDKDFIVDFGDSPGGPTLSHEMRYPGGDCTSDIWLARD